MRRITAGPSTDVDRLRALTVVLPGAALVQLLGQVLLRWPGGGPDSVGWDVAHVVLVLGALTLLAALLLVAQVAGPGIGTWLGADLVIIGQASTLAVLAIDLGVVSARFEVIETLDAWDFLAVVGTVVLLLELRRRRGAEPGTDVALVTVAVPAVEGLVVAAAAAIVVGFAALAHSVATRRGRGPGLARCGRRGRLRRRWDGQLAAGSAGRRGARLDGAVRADAHVRAALTIGPRRGSARLVARRLSPAGRSR